MHIPQKERQNTNRFSYCFPYAQIFIICKRLFSFERHINEKDDTIPMAKCNPATAKK